MPGIGQRKSTGHRLSDTLSFGVISKALPPEKIQAILFRTDKQSERNRLLPAHILIYYIIALGFYMESSSREVLRFLIDSMRHLFPADKAIPLAGKAAISRARSRLGKAHRKIKGG